jgi:O-antigen/teichoic acid export membrane protein
LSDSWLPAEHGTDNSALRGKVTRGLTWTIIDQWGRLALNLVVFIVIARLVAPSDIGLVALAAVFTSFAQIFVDQGLADALVQRRGVTRAHIDTAFWVSLATGTILALVGILVAHPLAALFGEPELGPILQVLSLTVVLFALSSTQMALLRRELAFRSLALRGLFAIGGGSVVGIGMAATGWGAWALVGQQITVGVLSVAALWTVSPWRPTLEVSPQHFRQLFSFGINVVGSDILAWLSRRTDNLLIGFFLGPLALGLYTVAYRILEAGSALLIGIARKLAFPTFSRLQHDPERMRRAYLRVTRTSSAVVMPGFIGLALTAPELITVLFGSEWVEAGPVASVLFLIGVVYTVTAFSAALLNAAGRPDVVLRFRLVTTVFNVVGFAVAVQFGILAVAAAYVIRGYVLMPLNLHWLRKYAGIQPRDFLWQLRGVTAATAVMAVAILVVKFVLEGAVPMPVLLLAEFVAGATAFLLALWMVERSLVREMFRLSLDVLPSRRRLRRGRAGSGRRVADGGPAADRDTADESVRTEAPRGGAVNETTTVPAEVAAGTMHAEMAALVWQLIEGGVPLNVTGPPSSRPAALRTALLELAGALEAGGGIHEAESLDALLRELAHGGDAMAADAPRQLGVVLVLRDLGGGSRRVVAAHYVRPIERDREGHLQRRPPAVLFAWDDGAGRFEEFAWGVTSELAARIGTEPADFEQRQAERAAFLAGLVAAGVHEAAAVARAVRGYRLLGASGAHEPH